MSDMSKKIEIVENELDRVNGGAAEGVIAFYVVKKGDTLRSIASKNNMSVARLKSLNGLSSDADLYPGKMLKVEREY